MTKIITALLLGILCFTNIGCGDGGKAERKRKLEDNTRALDRAFKKAGVD